MDIATHSGAAAVLPILLTIVVGTFVARRRRRGGSPGRPLVTTALSASVLLAGLGLALARGVF